MSASHVSTASAEFLSVVEDWFSRRSEIFVLIRFCFGAGDSEVSVFAGFDSFRARLAALRAKDSVTVFRDHGLPLRGVVDDAFIEMCLAAMTDGVEYVVAETKPKTAGQVSWLHNDAGTGHQQLRESLEGSRGEHVLVGEYPPRLDVSDAIIAAYVPDADGIARLGPY